MGQEGTDDTLQDNRWDRERREPCDETTHGTGRDGHHVQLDLVNLSAVVNACCSVDRQEQE